MITPYFPLFCIVKNTFLKTPMFPCLSIVLLLAYPLSDINRNLHLSIEIFVIFALEED